MADSVSLLISLLFLSLLSAQLRILTIDWRLFLNFIHWWRNTSAIGAVLRILLLLLTTIRWNLSFWERLRTRKTKASKHLTLLRHNHTFDVTILLLFNPVGGRQTDWSYCGQIIITVSLLSFGKSISFWFRSLRSFARLTPTIFGANRWANWIIKIINSTISHSRSILCNVVLRFHNWRVEFLTSKLLISSSYQRPLLSWRQTSIRSLLLTTERRRLLSKSIPGCLLLTWPLFATFW
jgi:hypothetical protein